MVDDKKTEQHMAETTKQTANGKWYNTNNAITYLEKKCNGNIKITRGWLQYNQAGLLEGKHYRYVDNEYIKQRFNRQGLEFSKAGLDLLIAVHNFRQRIKESKK